MTIVVSVENLSKTYQLGQIGTGRLVDDLRVWWAKKRGRPNPFLRIGQTDHGNRDGETIWALKDVSLSVERGEVLGIIGKNGAGKSTLLKILSRITAPTSGKVKVKGRVASLLEVGTGFHPELTGRENIYLNGAILGMTRNEIAHKFEEIVDFSGVEPFIDTPVKRYSSGMYVRLAFAVAAHLEPEILLVDEVLAVGDAEFQKKCLGKMGEVAREGRTVLFVSHQMAAIANLCRRALLVQNGQIERSGGPDDVILYYLSSFNDASGEVALDDALVRTGTGNMRFTRAWIENTRGEKVTTVRSGDSVYFVASYETESSLSFTSFNVAFAIDTATGINVADLSSSLSGKEFASPLPRKGTVRCHVPRLPLNAGAFTYDVYAELDGRVEDWIRGAGRFAVEPGDYFSSGRVGSRNRLMLIQHEWDLHPFDGGLDR